MKHSTFLIIEKFFEQVLTRINTMTSSIVDQVKASHDAQIAFIVSLENQVKAGTAQTAAVVNQMKTLKADLMAAIAGAQSIAPADAAVLQGIIDNSSTENAAIVDATNTETANQQSAADVLATTTP